MPDFKQEVRGRLAGLNLSPTSEFEIVEEWSQHLQDQYDHALSGGASEEEAFAAVLLQFGKSDFGGKELEHSKGSARKNDRRTKTQRKTHMMADLWLDLRYGWRILMKNPGFTAVAVIALALGIGANSAIFSVVNTILLRPLPYKNPDRLAMLWEEATHLGFPKNTPSPANFIDWRNQNTVFDGMAAMVEQSFNLTGAGEPERVDGERVSGNLFTLLGVEPQLGRGFRAAEDQPGNEKVVILGYGLWQRRFAGDPAIIGQPLKMNGQSYTIIGVAPPNFQFPRREDQLWVPVAFSSKEAGERGNHYLRVIGRIKAGITLEQAKAEMQTIAARLAQSYPDYNMRIGAVVTPLHEELVGDIRPSLLILLGAVGFVLLICCANVANLLLARAAARQKEIALRLAMGASRSRLIRQFLAESVLLAAIGGGIGLILSSIGMNLLKRLIPQTISQGEAIHIDARVLAFTAGVSLLTGLVFGLVPAMQASHFNVNETLKESGRDSASGRKGNRIRGLLVISEVAVSFVLLIGAGLLINSFVHLRNLDPGFRADHLLTMKLQLPETKYPDKERRAPFYKELIQRVQALPGVESVAVASNLPLTYDGDSIVIAIEGQPDPPPDQRPDVVTRIVSPRYFEAMGIPLTAGRDFSPQDKGDSPPVVVISEKTAHRFWPGQDPIGKRLKPGSTSSQGAWREVIGVVKDVRQNNFVAEPKLQMYLPYEQTNAFPPNALAVRASVDPLSLGPTVRRTVWEVDKDQPVSDIRTMTEVVSEALARQRFSMTLLGIFAALALVLAAVGIYGVMSYAVAQRTHEIGIRMALGAQRGDVLKLTIGQGLRLVAAGVAVGLASAFILTRVMSSLLFGISATDPLTFLAISLVLSGVALLASYVPAVRAMKIDPMLALRYQ